MYLIYLIPIFITPSALMITHRPKRWRKIASNKIMITLDSLLSRIAQEDIEVDVSAYLGDIIIVLIIFLVEF